MDEIKIRNGINRECYTKILFLKNLVDAAVCNPPATDEAMGEVKKEMESAGKLYVELKQALSELLGSTAEFIVNADMAFLEADNSIAQKIDNEQ